MAPFASFITLALIFHLSLLPAFSLPLWEEEEGFLIIRYARFPEVFFPGREFSVEGTVPGKGKYTLRYGKDNPPNRGKEEILLLYGETPVRRFLLGYGVDGKGNRIYRIDVYDGRDNILYTRTLFPPSLPAF